MKEVSIVVVSYQCREVISQLLESLLCLASKYEVIIIDNNSTDGTVAILQEYYKKFNIVFNKSNNGFTKAVNQGIALSTSDYIFLLNPDAYLADDCIAKMLHRLKSNELIGAVSPNLLYPDGTLQRYVRRFPNISALLVEHFVPRKFWHLFKSYNKYVCTDLDLSKEQYVEQPAAAAFLYKKGLMLDERFFVYGSDLELCKRIHVQGKKILHVPDATVYHHQSKGGTNSTNARVKMYLQLDALYGYGLYFKEYRSLFYYYAFRHAFASLLFLTSILSIFKGHRTFNIKLRRLAGFVTKKNFRDY